MKTNFKLKSWLYASLLLLVSIPILSQTIIKKGNPANKVVTFWMQNSTTGANATGLTGASIGNYVSLTSGAVGSFTSIQYEVNGGTFANCSGTIAEIGKGIYAYIPTSGETNSAADTLFDAQATGCFDYPAFATVQTYKIDDIGLALLPSQGAITGISAQGATTVITNLSAPNANSYKGQILVFTSGGNVGQGYIVSSNTSGSNSALTILTALNAATAVNDTLSLTVGIGQKTVDVLTGAAAIAVTNGTSAGQVPTAAQIATQIFTDPFSASDFSTASTFGAWAKAGVVTVSPTDANVAGAVWNPTAASYNTPTTLGAKLYAAGSSGDPLSNPTTNYSTPGTVGYDIVTTITNALKASGATAPSWFNIAVDGSGRVTIVPTAPSWYTAPLLDGSGYVKSNITAITSGVQAPPGFLTNEYAAIASQVLNSNVDSTGTPVTLKQSSELSLAIQAGKFAVSYNATTRTQTTTYYKQDGVTLIATSTVIFDTTGRSTGKTVTFTNL